MPYSSSRFGIIVAVDGSPSCDTAIRWAVREALEQQLPLTLMHVVPPAGVHPREERLQRRIDDWLRHRGGHILDLARQFVIDAVGDATSPDVHTELRFAVPVPTLVDASREASMIVVGSRGLGALRGRLMGSVSMGLLHHAHCPVAVIHDVADGEDEKIANRPVLVGIDGSPASESATAIAFDEASRRGVALIALHAWSDVGVFPILGMDWEMYRDEGKEALAERLAGWQEQYPDVQVRRRLVCDQPSRELLDAAAQSQLVVVGSHGRGGYAGMLLGSVSTAVAVAARVPVIVARL